MANVLSNTPAYPLPNFSDKTAPAALADIERIEGLDRYRLLDNEGNIPAVLKPNQKLIDSVLKNLESRCSGETNFRNQNAEYEKKLRGEPNTFDEKFGEIRSKDAWEKDFCTQSDIGYETITKICDECIDHHKTIISRAVDHIKKLRDRIEAEDLAKCREFGVAEFPGQVALGLTVLLRNISSRLQMQKGYAPWPRQALAGLFEL